MTNAVASSPPLAGCTALLVEDEVVIAFLIEDMLRDLGCTDVFHAATVAEALAILERAAPDLAVIDVNLGEENGYAVAERLDGLQIPFVFATGYGQRGIDARWNAQPVLQKPFETRLLARALQAVRG